MKLRRYAAIIFALTLSMQNMQIFAAEDDLFTDETYQEEESLYSTIANPSDTLDEEKNYDNLDGEELDTRDETSVTENKKSENDFTMEDEIDVGEEIESSYIDQEKNILYDKNFLSDEEETIRYQENASWSFIKLETSVESPQKVGEEIGICATTEGDDSGLQFKFVWQKDNWKEWGVLQDFSNKNTVTWCPKSKGDYELIVDIQDRYGRCQSYKINYEVRIHLWEFLGIETDKKSPQEKYGNPINVKVNTKGDNEHLKYKFIWQRDNWAEWGILQPVSSKSEFVWEPNAPGDYEILVDIIDDGQIYTKSIYYTITEVNWDFLGISMSPEEIQQPGEPIEVTVDTTGTTAGLQYKFVWQRDGWQEWGVLREFSTENTVTWIPESEGKYELIVDILDRDGECETQKICYEIKQHPWKYIGIETDKKSPQQKYGDPIYITTNTEGDNKHLKYKFVWQKDNWKEWGVLQDFSLKNQTVWNPRETGNYEIIVDILDDNSEIVTKSIPFSIIKPIWNCEGFKTSPEIVQRKGNPVDISVQTTGNTKGLQYKFIWQRNNWEEWGVLRGFSEDPNITWIAPNKSGEYQLIVDIIDRDGKIVTQSISYWVATNLWTHEGVDVNQGKMEQVYTNIPVTGLVSGETEGLQYKFIWKKGGNAEGWSNGWGIIRNYSTENTAIWYPKEPGIYTIYCDVFDVDGKVVTKTTEYTVKEAPWKVEKIELSGTGSYFVGDTMNVQVVTSGETENLQYKFVCSRGEGWKDWEVVQEFSTKNTISIPVNKATSYNIYVDIMDQRGVVFDAISVVGKGYEYTSAGASSTRIAKGQLVTLYPNFIGPSGVDAQYKFVWMKNGSSDWGVLQNFSTNQKFVWIPNDVGTYTIAIDVYMNGIVKTQKVQVIVSNVKNGWYYESGYKYYYKNGVKQLDLDGILPKQSSYYIKVNRKACTVTVYAKDGNNGYIIPVKRFACSVGLPSTPTPTGTYRTLNKYRWHTLMGPSYGQYCTRIVGGILFHSVAGYNMTSYNLKASDYNKLGSPASHGCVRLCVRDAKWIYDNCSLGTTVNIYDSTTPGPLGKPSTIKIPSSQNWDPTDPNV